MNGVPQGLVRQRLYRITGNQCAFSQSATKYTVTAASIASVPTFSSKPVLSKLTLKCPES